MPTVAYIEKRFSQKVLEALDRANEIIAEYTAQGYELTLRQLYYQFVARGWLANTQRNYKNLGQWLNDGRLAGVVDWLGIVDRTRNLQANNHWDDPADLLQWAADGYGFDLWNDQPERVEVWVEKEALAGVVERPANEYDVAWFACRGYVSQSELWRAARRLKRYEIAGATPTIIHLGDHDPSGIDMTRDIFDRLELFGAPFKVERIALNRDQVDEYNPPPNPAKVTDSRYEGYAREHGVESWELDALEPSVLERLIVDAIEGHCDLNLLDAARERQDDEREQIRELADGFRDDDERGS